MRFSPGSTGPRDIVAAVRKLGFEAGLAASAAAGGRGSAGAAELDYWWRLFMRSMVFTVPLLLLAMVLPLADGAPRLYLRAPLFGIPMDQLCKWLLATPVQYLIGWRFHVGAWKALRRRSANMDVLVVLGTNASYLYSLIAILHRRGDADRYPATDFFETCAMIISFICLGKALECAAKGKTSEAIGQLLQLAPDVATLVTLDPAGRVAAQQEVRRSSRPCRPRKLPADIVFFFCKDRQTAASARRFGWLRRLKGAGIASDSALIAHFC